MEVGIFRFTAVTEDFVVNQITLQNGETAEDAVATAVSISYENEDGETVTQSSTLNGGAAGAGDGMVTFDGMEMFVPADGTSDVMVTIDTNAVSSSGADSGNDVQLTLDADTVEYTGLSSQETTTDAGTDRTADDFVLRKTQPTLSLASGSPEGADSPGPGEVFRFNIAADSHGYVTVDELTFRMDSTDNNGESDPDWNQCDASPALTAADFSFYNYDDLGTALDVDGDWTFLDSSGTSCGADEVLTYIVMDLTTSFEVAAGATETYSLYVNTTGAASGSDGDVVSFTIPLDTDVASLGGATDPDGAIIWDDDTQGSDIDGTYVENLPVEPEGSITY